MRFEDVSQLKGHISILGSIFIHFFRCEVAHGALVLSLWTDELVDVDGLIVEIHFGHVVHVVAQFGLQQIVGYHGVEQFALERHSIIGQHLHVVFDVLSNLGDCCIFVSRFENINNVYSPFTLMRNRHIKGLIFAHCKAQTHQFCLNGIGGSGLCV